jgi:hypothetical protein
MDGRYELARDALQSQYRRYQQQDTGRKLVALLFMMGKSQEAWSVLQNAGTSGDPYHVSIIGLRMANATRHASLRGALRARTLSTTTGSPSGVLSSISHWTGRRARCARSTKSMRRRAVR